MGGAPFSSSSPFFPESTLPRNLFTGLSLARKGMRGLLLTPRSLTCRRSSGWVLLSLSPFLKALYARSLLPLSRNIFPAMRYMVGL